jgi:hypothetical protein
MFRSTIQYDVKIYSSQALIDFVIFAIDSHVSGTSAGNNNVSAFYEGNLYGLASGMAPRAWLVCMHFPPTQLLLPLQILDTVIKCIHINLNCLKKNSSSNSDSSNKSSSFSVWGNRLCW